MRAPVRPKQDYLKFEFTSRTIQVTTSGYLNCGVNSSGVTVSVTSKPKLSIHLMQQAGQGVYILRVCCFCSGKNTNCQRVIAPVADYSDESAHAALAQFNYALSQQRDNGDFSENY